MGRAVTQTASPPTHGMLQSMNPYDGSVVGEVPIASPDDVAEAVARARHAQEQWRRRSLADRARLLVAVMHRLLDRLDPTAALVTAENGKPLAESYLAECFASLDALRWTARHAPALLASKRLSHMQPYVWGRHGHVHHDPLGVVGIISPWNFPLVIPLAQTAFAVAAGNAVVLKPAPSTPLIGQLIADLFASAGAPEGLVSCVHGGAEPGSALAGGDVDLVIFTGSEPAGRSVMQRAADAMTPAILELGGKDAMLVLDDARIGEAVEGALWGAFTNSGQACASVERIFVDHRIYPEFVERLCCRAQQLRQGPGAEPGIELSVLTTSEQFEKVVDLVDAARSGGATIETGGQPADVGAQAYTPTVITGATTDSQIMQDEIFGPVVTVNPFDSDAQAVAMANDSRYGLACSIWSSRPERARRMAEGIEAGSVWINEHMYSFGACQAPWGGRKQSGVGVTHSAWGLWRNTEQRYVGGRTKGPALPPIWQFPYSQGAPEGFGAAMRLLYGSGVLHRAQDLWSSRSSVAQLLVDLGRRL